MFHPTPESADGTFSFGHNEHGLLEFDVHACVRALGEGGVRRVCVGLLAATYVWMGAVRLVASLESCTIELAVQ